MAGAGCAGDMTLAYKGSEKMENLSETSSGIGVGRAGKVALALCLSVGLGANAGASTLQDMFSPGESFTRDGLEFYGFAPVLSNSLPSVSAVQAQLMLDPAGVTSMPFLDFTGAGVFSKGTGNAGAADASNIGFEILEDDTNTVGIDPGFRLHGGSEWQVDAGFTPGTTQIASAQLSAFVYNVRMDTKEINSAGLAQSSTIDAVGPDVFSFFPFSFPDVAASFTLQFVLDDPAGTDLAGALMNYTLESGLQTSGGVVPSPYDQLLSWEGLADTDEIRVVSVVGLGATSGGGITLNTMDQRIDPPPGGIPEPVTWWLLLGGLTGLFGVRRARSV